MANRLILYTSQSEGITIGVSGETWMECLTALADEFGEGVLPMYEGTKDEFQQTCEAVAETFADELSEISEDLSKQIVEKADRDAEYEEAVKQAEDRDDEKARIRAAIASVEQADKPDSGASQESLPADDAPPAAGSDGDPVCSICGATTTKDFATLTRMEHGEVRCPDCTP